MAKANVKVADKKRSGKGRPNRIIFRGSPYSAEVTPEHCERRPTI